MRKARTSYSRLLAYKKKQLRKKLFWYSLLTTAVLTVIGLYGVKYFPRWIDFITSVVNQNEKVMVVENEALLPPTLQALPEYVNTPTPEIRGTAMSGKIVELFLDGSKLGETVSSKDGQFIFVPREKIADGKHKLTAQLREGKNESSLSLSVVFVVDTTPPDLVIESPEDGAKLSFGPDEELVTEVKGQSEAGVEIRVNDRLAKVDIDGSFTVMVPLQKGENTLKAVSVDKAGNSTEKKIKVTAEVR